MTDRLAAPVVFLGRLHVFWTQVTTRPTMEIVDGGLASSPATSTGSALRYTTLRADGSWTAPQALVLDEAFPRSRDVGRIEDGLVTRADLPDATSRPDRPATRRATRAPTRCAGRAGSVYLQPNATGSNLGSGPYLSLMGRNFSMVGTVDLFRRKLKLDASPWISSTMPLLVRRQLDGGTRLYYGFPPFTYPANVNGWANLVLEEERAQTLSAGRALGHRDAGRPPRSSRRSAR